MKNPNPIGVTFDSGITPAQIERVHGTSRNCADSGGSYTHWVWDRISPTHVQGWEYSAPPEEVRPGHTFPAGRWSVTRPTGRTRIERD